MKRSKRKNQQRRVKEPGPSRYEKKRRAGNQMYGPGCCAHTVKLLSYHKEPL
jgi:hypothetical protein